jgi:CRISPR/Cas system-associated protein Cas10 (large subunit of type III CRISPR-Cas system)
VTGRRISGFARRFFDAHNNFITRKDLLGSGKLCSLCRNAMAEIFEEIDDGTYHCPCKKAMNTVK